MSSWMFVLAYVVGVLGTATLYFRHVAGEVWTYCRKCGGGCQYDSRSAHREYKEERADRRLSQAWFAILPGIVWPLAIVPMLIFKLTPLTPAESKARIAQLERELEMERAS